MQFRYGNPKNGYQVQILYAFNSHIKLFGMRVESILFKMTNKTFFAFYYL